MRFDIEREAFLRPLQAVVGVVERRQTLPVLSNVLMVADSSGVSLTATDLEVELHARAAVEVESPGEITVPGRKILDIVKNLPEGSVPSVALDKDRVNVRAGSSRFALATLPASDFPTVEEIGEAQPFLLAQGELRRLIERTYFAMALQDVRYYLNGLLLEIEPERLRAVATDGHRLATDIVETQIAIAEPQQVIVPRKGVQELLRLLQGTAEVARIELGRNHIRVALPDIRFTSKLIDGRFPDYRRVIPEGGDKLVVVDRGSLRQALVRTSILSNEKYRGVRLSLGENSLRLLSHNPEQEEAEEEMAVEYADGPMEIGFNSNYLLDALGAIDRESVEIVLTDANSSCLIRGAGDDRGKYVVMPMRL